MSIATTLTQWQKYLFHLTIQARLFSNFHAAMPVKTNVPLKELPSYETLLAALMDKIESLSVGLTRAQLDGWQNKYSVSGGRARQTPNSESSSRSCFDINTPITMINSRKPLQILQKKIRNTMFLKVNIQQETITISKDTIHGVPGLDKIYIA